ncbi:MAG: tRNA (N(6)-L-threonylcarbamoyladenosine(37)-C(2))-methylthiotransferase MtaB [Candidatus Adiutrix sp.]
MPRALVVTLGCKVNQFESSSVAASLLEAGYEVLSRGVGVDLVVINTCTVTEKADHEALALIRRLKRQNPKAKIVATGCLAQSNPDLLAQSNLVHLVLGQQEKANLSEYLRAELGDAPLVQVSPLGAPTPDFGTPLPERTRAFYKIQDGCEAFCTYCAVPISRGPSRSLGLNQVLDGLREYMIQGLAEVVLCGIHLGQWGQDLSPPLSLSDLLHTVEAELSPDSDVFRLRLSSIEPLEVNDDLIGAYDLYPWLAPHFHLPLQSASDRILTLMGRPYTQTQFCDLVLALNKRWPYMSIGVDIMVGFPGETEADFEISENILAQLPISYFHVFPYSIRPNTPAATLPNQVPEHIKRGRSQKLKALNQIKRQEFARLNFGRTVNALVENTPHAPSGRLKVLTDNYLQALLPSGAKVPFNCLIPVTLAPSQNQWGLLEAMI